MRRRSSQLTQIRRDKVLELLSSGYTSHREIARELNVNHVTVDRDVRYWMTLSDENSNHFKNLPFEIDKCKLGVELTIKEFTKIINDPKTEIGHRLTALSIRLQVIKFKMAEYT